MPSEYQYIIDVSNDPVFGHTLVQNIDVNTARQRSFMTWGEVVGVLIVLIGGLLFYRFTSLRLVKRKLRFIIPVFIGMAVMGFIIGATVGTYAHNRTGCHKILVQVKTTDYALGAVCQNLTNGRAIYVGFKAVY